ncbi:fused MFS/spermidine synthase [candidate division TA06 bacterium]|nr:fused MFS/spermidine synthase [candidate division TA06 bacterium]
MGALLTGFFLIRTIGLFLTNGVAALINLLIAGVALLLSRKRRVAKESAIRIQFSAVTPSQADYSPFTILLVPFLMGISGFAALGYEVVLTRSLAFFMGSSTHALSIMLATFLAGIALGSFLAARFSDRLREPLSFLGWTTWGTGFTALLSVTILTQFFFHLTPSDPLGWVLPIGKKMIYSSLIMILPTFLSGIAIPLAVRIVHTHFEVGRSVGDVFGLYTLGGVLGSLFTGFLLIPVLGIQKGITLLIFLHFFTGLLLVALSPGKGGKKRWGTLLFLSLLTLTTSRLLLLKERTFSLLNRPGILGESLYYREGISNIVEVIEGRDGTKNLFLDGQLNASSSHGEFRLHQLHALLPILLHEEPREVLLVALGSGMTAGATRLGIKIENVDCVEISGDIVEAASTFEPFNRKILKWPKFHLFMEDRMNYLLTTQKTYDVIVTGIVHPKWNAGNAALYGEEYYTLCKKRLKEKGLFCQWVPLDALVEEDYQMILKTFFKVFPYSTLWFAQPYGERGSANTFLIGSRNPHPIHVRRLNARIHALKSDLKTIGIHSFLDVLDCYIAGGNRIRTYVQDASLITSDHPYLEFSPTVNHYAKILASLARYRETAWHRLMDVDKSFQEVVERRFRITGICIEGDIQKLEGNTIDALLLYQKAREQFSSIRLPHPTFSPHRPQADRGRRIRLPKNETIQREIRYLETAKEATLEEVKRKYTELDEHLILGYLYQKENRREEAIAEYQKVQKIAPDHLGARYNLALLYHHETRYEEAIQEYETILQIDPSYADALAGIGITYNALDQTELAITVFEEAHRLQPQDPLILYNLGEIYREGKQYMKAREAWEKALKLDPHNAKVHAALGALFAIQGSLEVAEVEFLLALKTNPLDHETLGNLGILYARLGDRSSAIQMLERALQLDPENIRLKTYLEQFKGSL